MKIATGMLLGALALVTGCSASDSTDLATAPKPSAEGARYVLATEPAAAVPVGTARETVQDTEEVTLVGRVGGSADPFVDGLVAFTIVDPKVPYCPDEEGCPTPWDYCCKQDQVKENVATVKLVDDDGKIVTGDARQLLGIKELATVVVQGKATRDDQGNLTVTTSNLFVRSGE